MQELKRRDWADIVVRSTRIYTAEAKRPCAQAVALKGNKIVEVGTDEDIEKHIGQSTKVIDAKSRSVLPGIIDSHAHFIIGAVNLGQINLNTATSLQEIQQEIKSYAESHPDKEWLIGRGWRYNCFPNQRLPRKEDIDAVVSDRPVYLKSYDGHSIWVNSKGLELADITKDFTYDGYGGIVRDADTKEPIGFLKEKSQTLVTRLHTLSQKDRLDALRMGMKHASSLGVTSVHVYIGFGEIPEDVELYQTLLDSEELTVRIFMSRLLVPGMDVDDFVRSFKVVREKYDNEYIRANLAKMFMDGVMETRTAAMLKPYSNEPSEIGSTVWLKEDFNDTVAKLDKEGFQVTCHSIGDKAVRWNLDAYEYAQTINGKRDSRHAVTHIECVHPRDIPRFEQLGVICNMQPQHASAEEIGGGQWVAAAGHERTKYAFPWESLSTAGGRLAFGSDWPVVTLNPMTGIYGATVERSPALPEQHVSLEKAIDAYTINGAYSSFEENIKGSIKKGKLADMVILSHDLFSIPKEEIRHAKVVMTIFDGKVIYEDKEFPSHR